MDGFLKVARPQVSQDDKLDQLFAVNKMHGGLFHAPAEQSGNIYRPAITRQITALGLLLRSADQTVPFLHFVPRSMFPDRVRFFNWNFLVVAARENDSTI